MQKITPFLWFDDKAGVVVSGRPEGSAMTINFQLEGLDSIALS